MENAFLLSTLKPNPINPRFIRDERFKTLVRSLKEFPKMLSLRPIVYDPETMEVLGGNMRLRALTELKYTEVPAEWVKSAAELTPEERERFIIADNVELGEWDTDKLANEWDAGKLVEWGVDVAEWGNKDTAEASEDDFDVPDKIKTDIVPGDLFEIGPHRLLCGDSANMGHVEILMDGNLADMMFTDPPYGVNYTGKTRAALKIESDDLSEAELAAKVKEWFSCAFIVSKPGAYWLATVPAGPLHSVFLLDWKERGILRQVMVWVKDSMVLGHSEYHYKHEPILFGWIPGAERLKNDDRTKTTVWEFNRPKASREHPTMKPVEMWGFGIKNHSKQGDVLYEPFLGSGTTMVAAHQLGRRCFGMEIDPKYCQVIIDRMKKLDPAIEIRRNGK